MARITKADLEQLVVIIRNATGDQKYFDDQGYFIEYAAGQPRLYLEAGRELQEVSPRLSARELATWLEGFIKGLEADIEVEEEEED